MWRTNKRTLGNSLQGERPCFYQRRNQDIIEQSDVLSPQLFTAFTPAWGREEGRHIHCDRRILVTSNCGERNWGVLCVSAESAWWPPRRQQLHACNLSSKLPHSSTNDENTAYRESSDLNVAVLCCEFKKKKAFVCGPVSRRPPQRTELSLHFNPLSG